MGLFPVFLCCWFWYSSFFFSSLELSLTSVAVLTACVSCFPGCFEKKNAWSSSGMIHLDNLKELAKKFRLHKSIPNFFRDYTTEDSLVAVLRRYVRNNAAFLSLAPSVARARRTSGGHPNTDTAAGAAGGNSGGSSGNGGGCSDAPHAIAKTSSIDSASFPDGDASLGSSGAHGNTDEASIALPTKTTASGDAEHHHSQHRMAAGNFVAVLPSEGAGGGGASTGQGSRISGHNNISSGGPPAAGIFRGRKASEGSAPRRPLQPKRPIKVSRAGYCFCFVMSILFVHDTFNTTEHGALPLCLSRRRD